MEVEVNNPANKPMHNGYEPVLRTIDAPQYLPSEILYSGYAARKQYEQIEHDIYDGIRKTKKKDNLKFPAVLKILLGGGVIAGCIMFRKNLVKFCKNFVKSIFK